MKKRKIIKLQAPRTGSTDVKIPRASIESIESIPTKQKIPFFRKTMLVFCGVLLTALTMLLLSCGSGSPDDDFAKGADAQASYTVKYLVDPPCAATLAGESIQQVTAGGSTTEVKLRETGNFVFKGWSDGVTTVSRSDTPEGDCEYTALFEYYKSDLPVLFLELENDRSKISKERYTAGALTITGSEKEKYDLSAEPVCVRGRGNSTWNDCPKKSYRLQFDRKQQLLGIGEGSAKTWILQANAWDKTMLHNWSMWRLGELFSGVPYSISSAFVDLYINGEYLGVYCLSEAVEISEHRINIDDSQVSDFTQKGYLLEIDSRAKNGGGNKRRNLHYFMIDDTCYAVKSDAYSKDETAYIINYMQSIYDAIAAKSEEEFTALADISSFVDMYILEEFACDRDVGFASFYLFKEPGGKLYLTSPWDFDLALGNDIEYEDYDEQLMAAEFNPLFEGLMETDWFRRAVKERYAELRPLIAQMIEETAAMGEFLDSRVEENYDLWGTMGLRQEVEPVAVGRLGTYGEQVDYFCNWMKMRDAFLADYFTHME